MADSVVEELFWNVYSAVSQSTSNFLIDLSVFGCRSENFGCFSQQVMCTVAVGNDYKM